MATILTKQGRESQFELLRILSLCMIVMNHIAGDLNATGFIPLIVRNCFESFWVLGVNCLLLISGYFGIKANVKKFSSLYVQCAFYGCFGYLFHLIISGGHIGRSLFTNTFFVFSNPPGWWFIKYYIFLFLLSPAINFCCDKMSKVDFRNLLVCYALINVYMCFCWGDYSFDSGFSLQHFIFIYLIGRYIRMHLASNVRSASIFTSFVLLLLVWSIARVFIDSSLLRPAHGSPFNIVLSVLLFLLFSRLTFHSKIVNFIASSTLAAYLVHSNCYMSIPFGSLCKSIIIGGGSSFCHQLLIIIGLSFFTVIICSIFDRLRILLTYPFQKLFERILNCFWSFLRTGR